MSDSDELINGYSEKYDTFSEGVETGGLRNTAQIKTLICYIINKVNSPVTREKFTVSRIILPSAKRLKT